MKELFKAAMKGDMHAQYQLGNKYYIGIGIEQDFGKAEHWFKQASDHGHSGAKLYLDIIYESVHVPSSSVQL